MQYCSLQHWILLSSPDTSTTECCFHFDPAASFFLKLLVVVFPSSILDTFQPGGLIFRCDIFFAFYTVHRILNGKYTVVVCFSFLYWITFCQNSPLWPIHLGWPCMAWLIASLSYASPFATTRHWSMKGIHESPLNSKEIKTVNPRGNLPWIFIGRTDAEAEAPIVGHLMWRANSLEEILMLGKLKAGGEVGDRGGDGWMVSLTQWTWVWANPKRQWRSRKPWRAAALGVTVSKTWLSDWTRQRSDYKGFICYAK